MPGPACSENSAGERRVSVPPFTLQPCPGAHLRRFFVLGLGLAAAASAQSLRGSSLSLDRQSREARLHDFTYLRRPGQLDRFVDAGLLVPVASTRDYLLSGVSFEVARPEVKLFLDRFGADVPAPLRRAHGGHESDPPDVAATDQRLGPFGPSDGNGGRPATARGVDVPAVARIEADGARTGTRPRSHPRARPAPLPHRHFSRGVHGPCERRGARRRGPGRCADVDASSRALVDVLERARSSGHPSSRPAHGEARRDALAHRPSARPHGRGAATGQRSLDVAVAVGQSLLVPSAAGRP